MPETNETTEAVTVRTLGGARFDRTRKYGIEMECFGVPAQRVAEAVTAAGVPCYVVGYEHATRDTWKLTGDGSIVGANPFELVSPPLHGEEGLAQIKTVCAVLHSLGVRVNRSCGLHVHHDAADLNVSDFRSIMTMWWKYEDVIQFFISPSRRTNNYARPAVPRAGVCGYTYHPVNGDEVEGWKRAMLTLRDGRNPSSVQPTRYAAVNLHALSRHGTVEFRAHQGTTDYGKIEAWIVLTQWMVTRAKDVGCKISARMVGIYAAETRFFFRAIHWVNLTDPIVIRAKDMLRRRFNEFKLAQTVANEEGEQGPAARVSNDMRRADEGRI